MIDAARFSSSYTSFWNITTPTCEHLIRKINLSLYERENPVLPTSINSNRALIAEFGFEYFYLLHQGMDKIHKKDVLIENSLTEAKKRIFKLRGSDLNSYELGNEQIIEGIAIAGRLSAFFSLSKYRLDVRPLIPGCGFVDQSEADVVKDDAIYEVKAVDRLFRSSDLRQLITYAALHSLKNGNDIKSVGVYNPRRGISFCLPLSFVAREISGKSQFDLFEDIYQAISGNGVSR
ncbi:hypothetical protein [Brucella pituitosa]|uniref:PD-(D/E)XK endonuclease-like domain-containing protein n=1 Tax=Brucella pituitosa TaxID=571256 RepID=A0ABS3K4Z5_9HYPH|nr:hypothetical protein [Brucella pituitosa]MBO1041983.1 hypothetical protein [Brucella pituitosa]